MENMRGFLENEFISVTIREREKKGIRRPTALTYAESLSKEIGGAKIYLKREDLNFTGTHKISRVIGECLLAKAMGKRRVMCEAGARTVWTGTCYYSD